jgi:uncharacterized membrane protein
VAPTPLAPLVADAFASAFAIDEATGSPVGQAAEAGGRLVAVIWKNGVGTPLALPSLAPAGNYAAYAISADGSLIAGQAVDALGNTRSVIWAANPAGGAPTASGYEAPAILPVSIFTTGAGSSPYSSPNSVVQIGTDEVLVVGEAEDGDGTTHAALWRSVDGGAIFSPIDLGADQIASGVNASRLIVGEAITGLAPQAWQVDPSGVPGTPVSLGATGGSALAINANGRIAGWSGATGVATVWSGTTPAGLFGTASQAFSLNNEPQPLVVGHNGSFGFVKRAN